MIHDHPTKKLGLRPASKKPSLKLAHILKAIPDHDPSADHLAAVTQWILGRNSEFGVCGPVSVANNLLCITTALASTPLICSDSDIFDLYRRSGNPNFDPATGADDNGVDMQTMLKAALDGGIAGVKPIAFAQVDPKNIVEVGAAIDIFGCGNPGVTLEVAQQSQESVWDFVDSDTWGGHAIMAGAYTELAPRRRKIVSWQEVFELTDSFETNQMDEFWVIIWSWHLGTKQFKANIDQDNFKQAFFDLTGKPLVY